MKATIIPTSERDAMVEALKAAREFVADELASRRDSFNTPSGEPSDPEYTDWVLPAERMLAQIDRVLTTAGVAP